MPCAGHAGDAGVPGQHDAVGRVNLHKGRDLRV